MPNAIYHKIILRLWFNPRYGNKMGPNRTNPYVFNGSVEFPDLRSRFHVDLVDVQNYQLATSPKSMNLMGELIVGLCTQMGWDVSETEDLYIGQVFEVVSKKKWFVNGAVLYSAQDQAAVVVFFDEELDITCREELTVSTCLGDKQGRKSPDLFGANFNLDEFEPSEKPEVEDALAKIKAIIPELSSKTQ